MGDLSKRSVPHWKGPPKDGSDLPAGGGPPYDDGMELTERVIRVEEKVSGMDKRLELVEKDLRDLGKKMDAHFYWMLAAFAGMATLMAKGFHWF